MNQEVIILMVEDDIGHANLIKKNLRRAGIENEIIHFKDGATVLDFLFQPAPGDEMECGTPNSEFRIRNGIPYFMLLDLRLPKVDGVEILARIKSEPELENMPVVVITTTDDPQEVAKCRALGCVLYITKPVDYQKFAEAIVKLGSLISVVEVPKVNTGGGDRK